MRYITNGFTINMLDSKNGDRDFAFDPISIEAARHLYTEIHHEPAIGHRETAVIVADILETDDDLYGRPTIKLTHGDYLLVAQYHGPRLEKGATELPEEAEIAFWYVYETDGATNVNDGRN